MSESAGARFRAALAAESPLQVIGTITAYAGLMAKRTGYKALYLSGGGVAANSLGMPDLGITTMEDVLTDARRIVDATRHAAAGRHRYRLGRGVQHRAAPSADVRAHRRRRRAHGRPGRAEALRPSSRQGSGARRKRWSTASRPRSMRAPMPDFVIMARTDAAAVEGLDSAIDRAVAYVEAGADMVFPEAMTSLDDYRKVKAAVKVPILANLTEFGSTPFFTTDELRDAGVDIALYCCGAYRAMNKAALNFYETVRRDGTQKNIVDTLQTRAELYDFLGYHAYEDKLDALFAQTKK